MLVSQDKRSWKHNDFTFKSALLQCELFEEEKHEFYLFKYIYVAFYFNNIILSASSF